MEVLILIGIVAFALVVPSFILILSDRKEVAVA
jgi:hypothetical protein